MTQPAAPRKIVICIDGTGNEIGARATNILKLYKTLDKDAPDQEAHYFMGVGTYAGPQLFARFRQATLGVMGLAFGLGLEDDVLRAYGVLCHRYRSKARKLAEDPGLTRDSAESDHIYIAGFSRGAYAARVLAGFIHNFGLVSPDKLHLIAPVFRAYRRVTDFEKTDTDDKVFQALREFERALEPDHPAIRALLLFDTVSSMIRFRRPWKNLTRSASLAEFGTHASVNSNVSVRIVLHALAVNECRAMFRAQPWTPECDRKTGVPLFFGNNFRIESTQRTQFVVQRWFPGYHSDVGGSPYENESGIGKISLLWMLDKLAELEEKADAEDTAARLARGHTPLPGPRAPGLRLTERARGRYLEGKNRKARTPDGRVYARPRPDAPIHNSHRDGWICLLWNALEFLPKSLKRREKGPVAPARRGWLGFWYLPLYEPRHIPDGHEIDPSVPHPSALKWTRRRRGANLPQNRG
ncbi:MAG: DUF2235 domain-containing protein [Paracoccaceae bacterium]